MKKLALLALAVASLFLAGCSQTVDPGYKGKILSPAGYQDAILEPGKHWIGFRESLILLDTSTNSRKETIRMKTSDSLDLAFEVITRARIGGSDASINAMFDDIRQTDGEVSFDKVYDTYLSTIVRSKAREVVSQYAIDDINHNFSRITQELEAAISQAAASTPLQVTAVTLGQFDYPQVMVDAINLTKQRELDIFRIEAEKEADLKRKDAELANAQKQQEIDLLKAQSISDQNRIISEGIDPMLLEYRRLEVQERMADQLGSDGSVVFYPYQASGSTGLENRIFQRR
ncbi:SPFH domain-containing protein [Vreelandella venusta]|uniref:SPFH domain-containing protein n=1 Tax=Vreelandella venusta TaxID=44935 RepID=UPI0011736CB9|nr:SPFH domain-containing protein [Halomonas venusta]GEK52397.1 hypothetical protein HVE01_31180 [Halomonas venusta]